MYNDELLGRKVTSYQTSPLKPMFFEGIKDISLIIDVTEFPVMSRSYDVYFSRPVKKNNELHGVLVTAVSIENLTRKLPVSSKIISRQKGTYKYHSDTELIDTADAIFQSSLDEKNQIPTDAVTYDDGAYYYQAVDYKSISWVLAIRKPFTTALNGRQ